jgi:putative acetyltransferase
MCMTAPVKDTVKIRPETPGDIAAIEALTEQAFRGLPHSSRTEHHIVNALRRAGRLALSLVAQDEDTPIGHLALSPVSIDGRALGWFGLGPLSVLPARQDEGIGGALVRHALVWLRSQEAAGCVLLGDPGYYGRFGFAHDPALVLPEVPPHYFLSLRLRGGAPAGIVAFDAAFEASA